MLKKISDKTLQLLVEEVLPKLQIDVAIFEKDLDKILEYLSNREVFLAQNIEDGIPVDRKYLDDICRAVDEFNVDEDEIDLADLNKSINKIKM